MTLQIGFLSTVALSMALLISSISLYKPEILSEESWLSLAIMSVKASLLS